MKPIMKVLALHEKFISINGEVCGDGQGSFAAFLRLGGCNLTCSYCDTPQSQNQTGGFIPVDDVAKWLMDNDINRITVTGGEPLLQTEVLKPLMEKLSQTYCVFSTIETNGSLPFKNLVDYSTIVADYKLPSSGMQSRMMPLENFMCLTSYDFLKFVVCSEADYDFAKKILDSMRIMGLRSKVAFSPAFGPDVQVGGKMLFDWLKRDRLFDCILNIQLHKLIGVA